MDVIGGWDVDVPAFRDHFVSDFQAVLDRGAWPPELAELPLDELGAFLRSYLDMNAFAGIVGAETGKTTGIGIALTGEDRAERAFGQYLLRLATTYKID